MYVCVCICMCKREKTKNKTFLKTSNFNFRMKEKIIDFVDTIPKEKNKINMQEIFQLFLETDHLPSSKGEVYFIVSLCKTLKLFKTIKRSEYEIDWNAIKNLKEKWGFK